MGELDDVMTHDLTVYAPEPSLSTRGACHAPLDTMASGVAPPPEVDPAHWSCGLLGLGPGDLPAGFRLRLSKGALGCPRAWRHAASTPLRLPPSCAGSPFVAPEGPRARRTRKAERSP